MTVPLAVIAGIPLGIYQRNPRNAALERNGWEVRIIPGHDRRRADLTGVWTRVVKAAGEAPDAGAHLLLAHDREDERPRFGKLLARKSCRAVWLPRGLSRQYGAPDFQNAFDDFLNFEESWRSTVRPSIDSPLLLPETAFCAEPSVRDVWSRTRNVNRNRDRLDAVEKTIARFRDRHRRRGCWRDTRDLIFRRGAPHGGRSLPGWQCRKLTFSLPSGFHFDVKHRESQSFSISDRGGKMRRFTEYTNVDPHGFLRGGR